MLNLLILRFRLFDIKIKLNKLAKFSFCLLLQILNKVTSGIFFKLILIFFGNFFNKATILFKSFIFLKDLIKVFKLKVIINVNNRLIKFGLT